MIQGTNIRYSNTWLRQRTQPACSCQLPDDRRNLDKRRTLSEVQSGFTTHKCDRTKHSFLYTRTLLVLKVASRVLPSRNCRPHSFHSTSLLISSPAQADTVYSSAHQAGPVCLDSTLRNGIFPQSSELPVATVNGGELNSSNLCCGHHHFCLSRPPTTTELQLYIRKRWFG